jgi:hypothetical protein
MPSGTAPEGSCPPTGLSKAVMIEARKQLSTVFGYDLIPAGKGGPSAKVEALEPPFVEACLT